MVVPPSVQVGGALAEHCRVAGSCSAGTAQELLDLMVTSPDLTVSVTVSAESPLPVGMHHLLVAHIKQARRILHAKLVGVLDEVGCRVLHCR